MQELVTILLKPFAGRLADRVGYIPMILTGLALLGIALICLPNVANFGSSLLAIAVLIGIAQALITISTIAFVGEQVDSDQLGFSIGLVGTLQNAGKVLGPLMAGLLMSQLSFRGTMEVMGFILLCLVGFMLLTRQFNKQALITSRISKA